VVFQEEQGFFKCRVLMLIFKEVATPGAAFNASLKT
jgi:hypothetical protein